MRSIDRLVAQRLAGLLVDEDGDRHAPGALARDAPVGPRLDHGADAVAALRREPARRVDGRRAPSARRSFVSMRDEPLRRVAEDQRRLGAPGMRIGMDELALRRAARRPRGSRRSPRGWHRRSCRWANRRACRRRAAPADSRCRRRRRSPAPRCRCARPSSKSSAPWPGAIWTKPVPSSSVTKSPGSSGTSKS